MARIFFRAPRAGRFSNYVKSFPGMRKTFFPVYAQINHLADIHGKTTLSNARLAEGALVTAGTASRHVRSLIRCGAVMALHAEHGLKRQANKGSARWLLTHGPKFSVGFAAALDDARGQVLPWFSKEEFDLTELAERLWLFLCVQDMLYASSANEAARFLMGVGMSAPVDTDLDAAGFWLDLEAYFSARDLLPQVKRTESKLATPANFLTTGVGENANRIGLGSSEPNHLTLTLSQAKGDQNTASESEPSRPSENATLPGSVAKGSRVGRLLACHPSAPAIVEVLATRLGPVESWQSLTARRIRGLIADRQLDLPLAQLLVALASREEFPLTEETFAGREAFGRASSAAIDAWTAVNYRPKQEYMAGLSASFEDLFCQGLFAPSVDRASFPAPAFIFRNEEMNTVNAWSLTQTIVGLGSSIQHSAPGWELGMTDLAAVTRFLSSNASTYHDEVFRNSYLWRALILLGRQISPQLFWTLTGGLTIQSLVAGVKSTLLEIRAEFDSMLEHEAALARRVSINQLRLHGPIPEPSDFQPARVEREIRLLLCLPHKRQLDLPMPDDDLASEIHSLAIKNFAILDL